MNHGAQVFMDDMTRHGFEPTAEAGLVVYRITPIDGAHSGTAVETGVSTNELTPWPEVPPHWIHLPGDVGFSETNSRASSKPGWLKHSRQFDGWGDAPPSICWVSHVRAALGEATE